MSKIYGTFNHADDDPNKDPNKVDVKKNTVKELTSKSKAIITGDKNYTILGNCRKLKDNINTVRMIWWVSQVLALAVVIFFTAWSKWSSTDSVVNILLLSYQIHMTKVFETISEYKKKTRELELKFSEQKHAFMRIIKFLDNDTNYTKIEDEQVALIQSYIGSITKLSYNSGIITIFVGSLFWKPPSTYHIILNMDFNTLETEIVHR